MNRKIFALVFSLVLVSGSYAVSVESLADHPDKDYPLSHTIRWEEGKAPELKFLPDLSFSGDIYRHFMQSHPEISVERLYRIDMSAKYGRDISDKEKLEIYTEITNILGKPETQKGYKYHSSRKNEDVVLFEELYISTKDGKTIPGFSFSPSKLPKELSYYQYVDEINFSGAVFKQNIKVSDDSISYESTNIEPIKLFVFTISKKRSVKTDVIFFISGNYVYIYNLTQVLKEPSVKKLGIPIHIPSMLKKRMDVMALWLEDKISTIAK